MSTAIGTIIILIASLAIYFVPSIVAGRRDHQFGMVFVLNLFLGWTLVGWVVALAIAMGDRGRKQAAA